METLALLLHPLENEFVTLRRNTFQNYVHLEYLILEDVSTQGIRLELPISLVYLRWKNGLFVVCPVDFTHLENLAALEFLDCKSMKSLPPDVVQARKLMWLELEGCELFMELPFGLSNCLEHLGLNGTGLSRLPRDLGKLKRLTSLHLNHTELKRVPERLCRLEMLRKLELRGTEVTTLPESFSDLKSLEVLNLVETKLCSLPESIGQLQNLARLDLDRTPLEKLPDSICRLHSLSRLSLTDTQLTTLPSDIGNLVALRVFYVSSAKWRGFPRSFGRLPSLDFLILPAIPLDASEFFLESEDVGDQGDASTLDRGDWQPQSGIHLFPSQSPTFQAVRTLTLYGKGYAESSLPTLFSALQHLPLLATLELKGFDLPEMIPSNLGNLTGLQTLLIVGWERLRELPKCLGKLCKLWGLALENLPRLLRLPEFSSAFPLSMEIYKCGSLQVEGECSTSEGHTGTPLDSLNVASPSWLQLHSIASDSWSILECFLECCGKHYSDQIDYAVEREEWEKARKMAIARGAGAEDTLYVLDSTLVTKVFPEMCCRQDRGLPGACASSGCHPFSARDQCLDLLNKTSGQTIEVVALHREQDGNEEDCADEDSEDDLR